MCGRFVSTSSAAEIATLFDAVVAAVDVPPNFNLAPTTTVYGVVQRDDVRYVENFSWGLVPSWANDRSRAASLINARCETITERPSFRSLVKSRRCIIPMSGYYEWMPVAKSEETGPKIIKQPFYFTPVGSPIFAAAGLWTTWKEPGSVPEAPELHSCVLITTDANETVAAVHNRMPVLLNDVGVGAWLKPGEADLELLRSAENQSLSFVMVDTAVNSTRNRGPHLIAPIKGAER